MTSYEGIGVFDAIAVGRAKVFCRPRQRDRGQSRGDTAHELERLAQAEQQLIGKLEELYQETLSRGGGESAEIFEIHKMMVEDEDFRETVRESIVQGGLDAVSAVERTGQIFARRFAAMEGEYMQARAADVLQIAQGIVGCLNGDNAFAPPTLTEDVILCADDLSPAETVLLDRKHLLAIVTARGSVFSHTAILAKSMGIPAIVGVGEAFLQRVREGDLLIADGESGRVILSPDADALDRANIRLAAQEMRKADWDRQSALDSVTLDGRRVELAANIGSLGELRGLAAANPDGIGLFRSEFLYLEKDHPPTEEEQYAVYRQVLREMGGRRVIIRTLDIGADKQAAYLSLPREENPAMGLRAIRLCLDRPQLFKTQLCALYRASTEGNLSILFPMITNLWELREAIALCNEVREELTRKGVAVAKDVPIGVMIETPAAALISHRLAELCDFFSIGTNDLTQYTLACDRQNQSVARFCDPHHEAILGLIAMTVANAHANGAWVGICGELAADLTLTETFLRMGVDELSVSPAYLPRLKERVRGIDLRE